MKENKNTKVDLKGKEKINLKELLKDINKMNTHLFIDVNSGEERFNIPLR